MPPRTTKGSNADQAKELLLWARRNKIVITSITVGDVGMTVADLGMVDKPDREVPIQRKSIYEDFGGDALADAQRAPIESVDITVEDDE